MTFRDEKNPGCRTCRNFAIRCPLGDEVYTCEPETDKEYNPVEGFTHAVYDPYIRNKNGDCHEYLPFGERIETDEE